MRATRLYACLVRWAHLDSNQGLPGYEPGALTAELWARTRAGDGIRTRDSLLGRQALYQLSYTRARRQPWPAAVGARGLEPPTPASQTLCATNCATPRRRIVYPIGRAWSIHSGPGSGEPASTAEFSTGSARPAASPGRRGTQRRWSCSTPRMDSPSTGPYSSCCRRLCAAARTLPLPE